jgi:hypothetical protein
MANHCASGLIVFVDPFTVGMESGNESECGSPGHCIVASASNTTTSVSMPRTPVDVRSTQMNVVTPVTQMELDLLMHTYVITPPVTISPASIETPPIVLYTHVSICSLVVLFVICSD